MRKEKLDELAMRKVLAGGVVAFLVAPGEVARVRLVNGSVVIDKLAEAVYNKRHGVNEEGGSEIDLLGNP